MSSHTPVIVGVAHTDQRSAEPEQAREPLDLMVDAARCAAEDAGVDLKALDSIRVTRGMWPYLDPGRAIAELFDLPGVQTGMSPYGGNYVQTAVNRTALDIQAGRNRAVLITGAECGNTQAKAARQGVELAWRDAPGTPDIALGEEMEMRHEAEKAVRIGRPIQVYPLFEIALRHHLGLGVEDHLVRISELWSRFSNVAKANPNAWIREAKTPLEIRTPSALNRRVSFPYPKFMNSNNNVDQGAALLMMDTDTATRLGIPESKWIYPWAGTDGHDHPFVSNRDNLYSSPAIRIAGGRCLELAGLDIDDIDLVDVYSCFPSAVQVAARELGLDIERPLTVTGGLTWAGGPLNNYVMHAIVRMVQLLRSSPEQKGLITANGGYLTKHAFGIYSATPCNGDFRHADVQDEIDLLPKREVKIAHDGAASIEAYSVMYDPEGPNKGFIAAMTESGERAWGVVTERDTLEEMTQKEFCARPIRLKDHVVSFD